MIDKELLKSLKCIKPIINTQNFSFEIKYDSIKKMKVWKYDELLNNMQGLTYDKEKAKKIQERN